MAVRSASGREAADYSGTIAQPDRRSFVLAGAALGAAALCRHLGPAAGPTPADWMALRRRLSTHELSLPGEAKIGRAHV